MIHASIQINVTHESPSVEQYCKQARLEPTPSSTCGKTACDFADDAVGSTYVAYWIIVTPDETRKSQRNGGALTSSRDFEGFQMLAYGGRQQTLQALLLQKNTASCIMSRSVFRCRNRNGGRAYTMLVGGGCERKSRIVATSI
jgi:hypothetical protein